MQNSKVSKELRDNIIEGAINSIPIINYISSDEVAMIRKVLSLFSGFNDQAFTLCTGVLISKMKTLTSPKSFTADFAVIANDALAMLLIQSETSS